MSYLDIPRIHFAGRFFTDPSTINNDGNNYNPARSPLALQWNPSGWGTFKFENCVVKSAVLDASGAVKTAAADDPIIGATVEIGDTMSFGPKLVDLDPEWQSSSQIYGLKLSIKFAGEEWIGTMETATLRDLWLARAPHAQVMTRSSGTFQSVINTVSFTPVGPSTSAVFNAWKVAGLVSIRFVTYAYDIVSHYGKVVGTLGPGNPAEPRAFLNARRLESNNLAPTRGPRIYNSTLFGPAPFKVDEARKRVVIDLGNAIPETSPGGPRVNLGTLKGRVTPSPPASPEDLGAIDYSQARYETTAGVEELTVTAAQIAILKSKPLELWADQPFVRTILSERPRGSNLEVAETTVRLNPGESKTVDIFATRFGRPEPLLNINARLTLGGLRNTTGLTFTVVGGRTDATGRAQIKFTGSDPGKARLGGDLDGQLYLVELDWGIASPPAANDWRARIVVKVYDTRAAVASPKWADVQDIFAQYARLYPAMNTLVDFLSHSKVQNAKDRIRTTMTYPESDARFMPVTRDLSRDKRDLILRWIAAGAP